MSVGKERRERGKSCSNLEAARTGGKCIDTMAFAAARMILKDKRRKTSKEDFGGPRNRSKVISRRDFFSLLLLHSREKTTTIQPPKELRWMFNYGCFSFLFFFFFFFSLQQTRQRKISKDKIKYFQLVAWLHSSPLVVFLLSIFRCVEQFFFFALYSE